MGFTRGNGRVTLESGLVNPMEIPPTSRCITLHQAQSYQPTPMYRSWPENHGKVLDRNYLDDISANCLTARLEIWPGLMVGAHLRVMLRQKGTIYLGYSGIRKNLTWAIAQRLSMKHKFSRCRCSRCTVIVQSSAESHRHGSMLNQAPCWMYALELINYRIEMPGGREVDVSESTRRIPENRLSLIQELCEQP